MLSKKALKLAPFCLALLVLSGCKFLSNGQVTALRDRVLLLEKRAEVNGQARKILLRDDPGINPAAITVLDQNTKFINGSAAALVKVIGRHKDGE